MTQPKPFMVCMAGYRSGWTRFADTFAEAENIARRKYRRVFCPIEINGLDCANRHLELLATINADGFGRIWIDLAPEGAKLV